MRRLLLLTLCVSVLAIMSCGNDELLTRPETAGLGLSTTIYDWDFPPTSFSQTYIRTDPPGCEVECAVVQGIRSGYTGGSYGVDANDDGIRDGTLTADYEMISEVKPVGALYEYTWQLSNLGSGAGSTFLGCCGPQFTFSPANPLLGTAGVDRLVGTGDDLAVGQIATDSRIGGPPGSFAWGIIPNPSTGTTALLYAPQQQYTFTGFFQPVDNQPVMNKAKAGRAIPVKFSLGGDQGLDIFADGYPQFIAAPCSGGNADLIEQTTTANASGLIYDATSQQYTYVWKTDKSWVNQCGTLYLNLKDGSSHQANFQLT